MKDILFKLSEEDYDALLILQGAGGFRDMNELLGAALSLIKWVIDGTIDGGQLGIIYEKTEKVKMLDAEFLRANKI